MFSTLPIKVSAPLVIGFPVLMVGVWLSTMWNGQAREAVTELADRNIEQIHKMTATKVVDVLSISKRVCELNGHLARSATLPPAVLQDWRPTLAQQARSFDMLSAISWGSADGRTASVSRYADGSYFWAIKEDASSEMMAEWRLNKDGTEFGMDRLQKLIRTNAHRPAAEISEEIRDALATFRGPVGQADDPTFVIVKVL